MGVPAADLQRTCRHCDYDLRGLPVMAPCPECGTPGSEDPHFYTSFDACGRRIVLGYAWRLTVLALVAVVLVPATYLLLPGSQPAFVLAVCLLGLACALLVAPPWRESIAAQHRLQASDPICRAARWGGTAWPVVATVAVVRSGNPPPAVVMAALLLLGTLHFSCVLGVLERLAGWMRDSLVAQALRVAQVACLLTALGWLASCLAAGLPEFGRLELVSGPLRALRLPCIAIGLSLLVLSLACLAKTALANVLHYHENYRIEMRRLDRLRRDQRSLQSRLPD